VPTVLHPFWTRDKRFRRRHEIIKNIQESGRENHLEEDMGSFFDTSE
jgi:hypothetical protein